MKLYFLQFLNKLNRIVKSYPDLEGYNSFIIDEIQPFDATNFNYADGVNTWGFSKGSFTFTTTKIPDYAIIVDENNLVTSRWYIEECIWKAYGAWHIRFHRDVLADFRDEIIQSTVLIEKATVSDNDPAIYNQEAITFNQIKKSEKLLKDKSATPWLVGYLSTDNSSEKTYTAASSNQIGIRVNGIENWEYYRYISEDFIGSPKDQSYNLNIGKPWYQNSVSNVMQYSFNNEGRAITDTQITMVGYAILKPGDYSIANGYFDCFANSLHRTDGGSGSTYTAAEIAGDLKFLHLNATYFDGLFLNENPDIHTSEEEGFIKTFNGQLIYDSSTTKTYRIGVVQTQSDAVERYMPQVGSSLWSAIQDDIEQKATKVFYAHVGSNERALYVKYYANIYRLTLSEVSTELSTAKITSSRNVLNDAPYTMFAIPYDVIDYKIGNDTFTSEPSCALAIAREISMELFSSKALYDLQLLPYCPRPDLLGEGYIDLRSAVATEHADYEIIEDNNSQKKSFILFCKESSFTFDIQEEIEITEKKVQNQCDTYRICSPNYNGVFEFNPAKNNGVDYFNVDCTYRPYNPYIHVNPNFKELYGNDYDDARGLVCAGDFSMPACTEKWLEYEAQNKNYQNSFDRQIQHMEIEQKYQRVSQIAGAVAGAGQGALAGFAMSGGNPLGAVIGGLVSGAAGATDVAMSEKLRSEEIRYAKDQFAFSLENIRALPNTLAKISAFNKNNKIFPFLEYYTCTEIERQAFRDMLTFDGMTVNRIGKIADYLQDNDLQYIKARLIRTDLHEDHHVVDVIASELEKGAYYDTRSD